MKRIAIVVSTVGYHWEELYRAYFEFRDAHFAVDLFTVDGRPATPDPYSLRLTGPAAWLGLGVPRSIAPVTARGKELVAALHQVGSAKSIVPEHYAALYLPGGHGCLFDVNRDSDLHTVISRLGEHGAVLSAVCHATSTFAFVTANGRSIVHGHALTGFPHPLDRALIRMDSVHPNYLPLPLINDDVLRDAGARHTRWDVARAIANPAHVVVSPPFITGVGPRAARAVARKVIRSVLGHDTEPARHSLRQVLTASERLEA